MNLGPALAELRAERDRLDQAITLLEAISGVPPAPAAVAEAQEPARRPDRGFMVSRRTRRTAAPPADPVAAQLEAAVNGERKIGRPPSIPPERILRYLELNPHGVTVVDVARGVLGKTAATGQIETMRHTLRRMEERGELRRTGREFYPPSKEAEA